MSLLYKRFGLHQKAAVGLVQTLPMHSTRAAILMLEGFKLEAAAGACDHAAKGHAHQQMGSVTEHSCRTRAGLHQETKRHVITFSRMTAQQTPAICNAIPNTNSLVMLNWIAGISIKKLHAYSSNRKCMLMQGAS